MKFLPLAALLAVCFLTGFLSTTFAQAPPARPVDGARAIIDAFKTYDIVALGEGNHGNEQGAIFREKLYRDPRFQALVNDIVVECGNSRHQTLLDRYIAGESVTEKEVRIAWLETDQDTEICDGEIWFRFFRTIRDVNQKLSKTRQFRVLLGNNPYPYPSTKPYAPVDRFVAELIQHEVLAKKHKALVVFGGMHFLRRFPPPIVMPSGEVLAPFSIVTLLEKAGVKTFVIWPFAVNPGEDLAKAQPNVLSWPKESLALIKDTPLGLASFLYYYPKGSSLTMRPGPNGPVMTDYAEAIGGVMQEQVDAVLYMGPKTGITFTRPSKELCADPDYVEMRAKRIAAVPSRFGSSSEAEAAFRAKCKAVLEGN